MELLATMNKLGLLSLQTLYVGWKKGWTTRQDIIDYSILMLEKGIDDVDSNIALLASGEYEDESVFEKNILDHLQLNNQRFESLQYFNALEKWRLAHLLALKFSKLSEAKKLQALENIYATFDYPTDMISCSIYSQDNVDPLIAMDEVITKLMDQFELTL